MIEVVENSSLSPQARSLVGPRGHAHPLDGHHLAEAGALAGAPHLSRRALADEGDEVVVAESLHCEQRRYSAAVAPRRAIGHFGRPSSLPATPAPPPPPQA